MHPFPFVQAKHQFCWLCGNLIALQTAKTDEHGFAVHEACYTERLKNIVNLEQGRREILEEESRPN